MRHSVQPSETDAVLHDSSVELTEYEIAATLERFVTAFGVQTTNPPLIVINNFQWWHWLDNARRVTRNRKTSSATAEIARDADAGASPQPKCII